jgi:methionyl-tRNA formyltransferase
LHYLRKRKIDIIISSNGHIFKEELLELPKIACINRHTSLLPEYGGVLPVFWAMLKSEKKFGVSIHYMVRKIDQGDVIYQQETILEKKNSLFKNYVIGFGLSIDATIKAIENLETKKIFRKFSVKQSTYYQLPKRSEFNEFRKKHLRTIQISDIKFYVDNLVSIV